MWLIRQPTSGFVELNASFAHACLIIYLIRPDHTYLFNSAVAERKMEFLKISYLFQHSNFSRISCFKMPIYSCKEFTFDVLTIELRVLYDLGCLNIQSTSVPLKMILLSCIPPENNYFFVYLLKTGSFLGLAVRQLFMLEA